MKVWELLDILEDMDEDTEIRLAMQPAWPFEYSIGNAIEVNGILYLAENEQLDHLPDEVRNELGWERG